MILFKQDWAKYPTAVPDYTTTNTSFLKLARIYKEKMGINNSEFLLALYQPELAGVDPYAEYLSDEIKAKIVMEAKFNPWYYFREIARIPPNSGNVPIRFKANRGNIALYWCFFNHVDCALIQIRQTGKSVSTDVLMEGLIDIWASNTDISLITKDNPLKVKNIRRLKEMRELLPSYFYAKHKDEADNTEIITNKRKGNIYTGAVGRSDKGSADKLGRGQTVPIQHYDEICYILNIEYTLPVALASGTAARDEAKVNGQPYGNIFTTTTGNVNTRDGRFAHKFITGGCLWSEHFFDLADNDAFVKVVDKGSRGAGDGEVSKPIVHAPFNHTQLGYSDEWLYGKLRENAMSGELADRDGFNVWTTNGEGSPIGKEHRRAIIASKKEPAYTEITEDSYIINWYIPQHEIRHFMATIPTSIGIDPSDALGGDSDQFAFVIRNLYTGEVVATGRFNETSIEKLARLFGNMIIDYPKLTMIPERKSSGMAMLDIIFTMLHAEGIDPFKRIYNRIVDEPEQHKSLLEEIKKPMSTRGPYFYDRFKRYFGYSTSGAGRNSRDNLYGDALNLSVEIGSTVVYDSQLIDELTTLEKINGRIDHASGHHDDLTIGWLLTTWFASKARNLQYYGLNPNDMFKDVKTSLVELTPKEKAREFANKLAMEEFKELYEILKDTSDPYLIAKHEFRLKTLGKLFDVQEVMGHSIDAMIGKAKEDRKVRGRLSSVRGVSSYVDRARKFMF